MSDTPIWREAPPELDRDPAAHERRARLIAQLHQQAIATANDLSARYQAIRQTAKDARRQRLRLGFFPQAPSFWRFAASLPGLIQRFGCDGRGGRPAFAPTDYRGRS